MTNSNDFHLGIIGDRINPGFKSTKVLFDNDDLAGIQALAVKQVEAGATYLDVNVGARGVTDAAFVAKVTRAIQEAVTVPLSFRLPRARKCRKSTCKTYDRARAGGALPIVNSITEHRWDLMDLYRPLGPFKVIVMASERVEDGVAKGNKTADEISSTARRAALRLQKDYGMPMDDIFIDISMSAVIADTDRVTPRNARRDAYDPKRPGPVGHPHHGRADQYRPATTDKGGGRLGPETFARMRLPDTGRSARFRYRAGHAVARLSCPAERQLRADRLQELSRANRQQRATGRAQILQGVSAGASWTGRGPILPAVILLVFDPR